MKHTYVLLIDERTSPCYPRLVRLTASRLRETIYRILDRILETGRPVEIERRGRVLKIVAEEPPDRLARLRPRDYLRGDPEEIVQLDWSAEWRP